MSHEPTEKPMYLLIALWVMAQARWVSAREISEHFAIPHSTAINTLSYILAQVGEIVCETKIIPNQLTGRGCQCKRLVKVKGIDPLLCDRLDNRPAQKIAAQMEKVPLDSVSATELNRDEKWQRMLSKSQRRHSTA